MFSPLKKKKPCYKSRTFTMLKYSLFGYSNFFSLPMNAKIFCTIINKWNLSRETSQMACWVSFQVDSPAMTTAESCLVLID